MIKFKTSKGKSSSNITRFTTLMICVFIVSQIITGPLYSYLGVADDNKEFVGVPLNQIARTYIDNGNLDDDDLAFISSIIPLEDIKIYYCSYIVDTLKFSKNFKLDNLSNDFFLHYFKIILKNPVSAFNAYVRLTLGYWSINHPAVWKHTTNRISECALNYLYPQGENLYKDYGIKCENLFSNDFAFLLFPLDFFSIPVSVINWMILFLLICFFLLKKYKLIICYIPLIALVCTLLIASPIWYWPRYEFAAQILVPFIILTFYLLRHRSTVRI